MQVNNLSREFILAADVGGSHITTGICDLNVSNILPGSIARTELSAKASAEHILSVWIDAFKQTMKTARTPVHGVALAMPGPFEYNKGISYIRGLNKYESLYGMDIKNYLADHLKLHPDLVKFRNDAESVLAGEVLGGAGKDFTNVMGITIGTGFGSAHCAGNVTRDINLGSDRFKDTISDDYLSTRWFLKRYHELTGLSATGVKDLALIADSNKLVRDIFKEFANNMSDFLAEPVRKLKPEIIVVCGNISRAHKFFLPQFRKNMNNLNVQLGVLGENAALIGAAGLFEKQPVTIKLKQVNS